MKKDVLSFSSDAIAPTAIIFGIVTVMVYFFVIRPLARTRPPQQQQQPNATTNNNNTNGTASAAQQQQSKSIAQAKCTRVPAHVNASAAKIAVNGGSNLLFDGLVAFKHTKAASIAASLGEEIRKERAKVWSRLLTEGAPPARGSVVAVAIPVDTVKCPYQRRVLYLLATYYNLLVILGVDESDSKNNSSSTPKSNDRSRREEAIAQLRVNENNNNTTYVLSEDVLPSHRIVMASTIAGRVAFVRQIQRIELVVDYDPQVKTLLSRFGHRVLVFEQQKNNETTSLGRALLL